MKILEAANKCRLGQISEMYYMSTLHMFICHTHDFFPNIFLLEEKLARKKVHAVFGIFFLGIKLHCKSEKSINDTTEPILAHK